MGSQVRPAGSWKDIVGVEVRPAGTWKAVTKIEVKVGGVWKEVWPNYTPISVAIDPASYYNTVSNNTGPYNIGFTANVTGGNGSETYTWTVTNTLGTGWSILSGQGTDNVQLECANGSDQEYTATLQVAVDDGTSSDTDSFSITIVYGTPP